MTPAEADRFLTDGASLWNAVQSCACEDNSYCVEDMKVKDILAQSLIQMEDFLYKPSMPKIHACCNNGTNAILKDVACHKGWLSQLLVDYFRHYTNL
jgi:hypothetical protein